MIKNKEKNKGHTREFRNDDPTTFLSHKDQQGAMLLDTIDDAKAKPKKKVMEPIEIPNILSVPRYRDLSKLLRHNPMKVIDKHYIKPETPAGLSQRFTQERLHEGKILKQIDKEMATERNRKNNQTTNQGGDHD
jgi:ribonuclease D